jgi:hypothetical protein
VYILYNTVTKNAKCQQTWTVDYSENTVQLKRCAYTGVTIMSNID